MLVAENRNFRNIWLGETSAHFGGQLTSFLLPLIAVTYLHADGTGVGVVAAVQFVPVVVLSLVAGVMVDRYPPRRTLVTASLIQGAALAVLGAFQAADGMTFGQLVAAAAVIGVATVFYEVAYQSTLPRILPLDSIASANGLHQATYSVSTLAGPAAAGFLVGRLGLSPTLTVAAACSAGAVASGLLLQGVKAPEQPRESALKAIGSGLRYTWSLRPIRDLCVQAGLSNLHEKAFLTVFLVFAVRGLGMSGTTVGVITGIGSVGALVGSLFASRLTKRWAVGGVLALGAVLAALGLLLVPVAGQAGVHVAVFASVGMMVNGFGVALFNVFAVSLRQAIPPDHQIGAVTASYRLVALGTLPLGALIGGALADALSPGTALWVVGFSYLVVSFWLTFSPLRGARTLEEARELGRTPDAPAAEDADRSSSA
ncbi:MFS transporter [Streptomyces europaeiscabiei]|uniref:MFS transporter n=2 Tax=Streptomyces TaxID=1883 RepID=UPI0029B6A340|nr:MFS transporter [Streptomyces europaeiscabiei]MDX3585192.1 MFS transporter [Streptomyces europaeiscabiei]MDX3615758.1 MFS transporter [Streptomyces europaeiscabiei]MDX3634123.1 MFS transporter [Streptomyces europaeiscabiei]MDX3652029.1 MFS transporter [Streptomyces europaeiscabiei]WUD33526.1 MFS transporter [Streptomyces europaeiscabiei]